MTSPSHKIHLVAQGCACRTDPSSRLLYHFGKMWSYFRLFFSNNYWALVRDPEKLFAGSEVVQRATLETARDAANHYFQRCAAEGVTRGYFEAENDANGQWSRQYADKMAGRQSDDLLLGDKIVSEAGEGVVRVATMLSLRRLRLCGWLIGVLSGEAEIPDELNVL